MQISRAAVVRQAAGTMLCQRCHFTFSCSILASPLKWSPIGGPWLGQISEWQACTVHPGVAGTKRVSEGLVFFAVVCASTHLVLGILCSLPSGIFGCFDQNSGRNSESTTGVSIFSLLNHLVHNFWELGSRFSYSLLVNSGPYTLHSNETFLWSQLLLSCLCDTFSSNSRHFTLNVRSLCSWFQEPGSRRTACSLLFMTSPAQGTDRAFRTHAPDKEAKVLRTQKVRRCNTVPKKQSDFR